MPEGNQPVAGAPAPAAEQPAASTPAPTPAAAPAPKKNTGLIIGIICAVLVVVAVVVVLLVLNLNKKPEEKKNPGENNAQTSQLDTSTVVGSYLLSDVQVDSTEEGAEFGAAMMKMFIGSISLEIKEDHTGVMNAMGEKTEFKWDDKNLTAKGESGDDEAIPYTYKDGKFTMTEDGASLIFEKKTPEEVEEAMKKAESSWSSLSGGDEDDDDDDDDDDDCVTTYNEDGSISVKCGDFDDDDEEN